MLRRYNMQCKHACLISHGFLHSLMQIRNKGALCRQVITMLFIFTRLFFCDKNDLCVLLHYNLQFSLWWHLYFPAVLFQLPGSSATRYPRTVQPFFQVLRRHKFWWSSKALPQWPPPTAYSQCTSKGKEENKDGPLRVGGINIRAKELHRYGDRRWGHINEGRGDGEATPATGPSHSQTNLHALRQAFARAAIHLLPRKGTTWPGCWRCYWWVFYLESYSKISLHFRPKKKRNVLYLFAHINIINL